MSDAVTPAPNPPPGNTPPIGGARRRPPVLIKGQVVVEVVIDLGGDDSPFEPVVIRLAPFSRDEEQKFHAEVSAAIKKAGDDPGAGFAAQQQVRLNWFAPRIKGWNLKLTTADDAPDAPINLGTVELLALPVWNPLEAAFCGEAGRVVGN